MHFTPTAMINYVAIIAGKDSPIKSFYMTCNWSFFIQILEILMKSQINNNQEAILKPNLLSFDQFCKTVDQNYFRIVQNVRYN